MMPKKNRILILTAVSLEKDAVMRGLCKNHSQNVDVIEVGVGPVAAAAMTSKVLAAKNEYCLVISTGIGGGFPGNAEVGSLAIANEIIGADLGVETLEGFCSLDELNFGTTKVEINKKLLKHITESLTVANLPVATGPIITVSTATGTKERAEEMTRRVHEVIAEGMEGYGVALAAQIFGIPALEIRAISNEVGPRDREAWRIKEALDILEKAYTVLAERLLAEKLLAEKFVHWEKEGM